MSRHQKCELHYQSPNNHGENRTEEPSHSRNRHFLLHHVNGELLISRTQLYMWNKVEYSFLSFESKAGYGHLDTTLYLSAQTDLQLDHFS